MDQRLDSQGNTQPQSHNGRKRLADLVREAIRTRNYSRRTGKTYWYWIRYFIFFHGKRHPAKMGAAEVSAFLSWLASERDVAAATQNQALHALLFLYKQVLGHESVETTMIYTHVMQKGAMGVMSPLYRLARDRGGNAAR